MPDGEPMSYTPPMLDTVRSARARAVEEAADWFVRLNDGEPTPDADRDFQDWLDRDPGHALAYADIQKLWDRSGPVAQRGRRGVSRRHVMSLAALLVAGAAGWAVLGRPGADFETARGERRSFALPDGSTLELAGDTRVAMAFSGGERRLTLLQGELFATVAPDAARPFIVEAGTARVTALGTAFSVGHEADDVRVMVTEHSVRLDVPGASADIAEGTGTTTDGRAIAVPTPLVPGVDLAWRDGQLVFAATPLDQAIATINRWREQQLTLLPGTPNPQVTLIGSIDGIDAMIDELARQLALRPVSLGPWLTILVPA